MPTTSPGKFFVYIGETHKGAEMMGVFRSKKGAMDKASEGMGATILDRDAMKFYDHKGRRKTRSSPLDSCIKWSVANNSYTKGAEMIGMDNPDCIPKWKKTLAEMEEDFRMSDDIFASRDKMEHRRAVENALRIGKPVPSEVLDNYPELNHLGKN